jgi:hypothetical protein
LAIGLGKALLVPQRYLVFEIGKYLKRGLLVGVNFPYSKSLVD